MAYTYVNKKTGEVIYLNRRVKTDFWEEKLPEEDAPGEENFEEETNGEETPETEIPEEVPAEEPKPKKAAKSRGK